jgi:nucleoside-diphosphate-sugar epimerase
LVLEHLKEINSVSVLSRNRGALPRPWPDEIRVLLDAEPGHAALYLSLSAKPDVLVLTIRGTEGTVRADLGSLILTVEGHSALPRAAARGWRGFGQGFANLRGAIGNAFSVATGNFDKTGGIQPLVARLYDAIRHGVPPPVTMEEGRRVVHLIERIWPQPLVIKKPEAACVVRSARPTVLVTGAGGFIGSHLVERLARDGVCVRALARPSSSGLGLLKNLDVEIVYGDLSNPESVRAAVEGVETVYHAGSAIRGNWEIFQRSSVVGTQNVIYAARQADVKRVVYFSSLAVYSRAGVPHGTRIAEDWPYASQAEQASPYSRAKIETEKMMLNARTDLPVTIVRPGLVIGPRGPLFSPHMGYQLKDNVFIVVGSGETLLPLVYIENLIDGLLLCAAKTTAIGKIYNFVDDESVSVLAYLNRFIEETKLPCRIIRVPYALPYCAHGAYELGAALGFLQKGVTSRVQLDVKHRSLYYDCERAKRELGWSSAVSIDEALGRTFRWYREARR